MKLAILDKDGTLTETVSGATFVQSPTDQKLIAGVQEAIAKLASQGYTLAIASNQGGVAAGHKTLEDAIAEMRYAMQLTEINLAAIAHTYENQGYGECVLIKPESHEELTHGLFKFRKPDMGMIDLLCTEVTNTTLWRGQIKPIFIGDRPEDEQAAHNAQIPFIHAKDWWIN